MSTLSSVPEDLAKLFHETYERLAPNFSYHTRKASAVPWDDVPPNNKGLMVAVAKEVQEQFINQQIKSVLDSIPEPTITDVFPSKPYDGTKTYEDMLQVVEYYKSTIQKIRSRYE